MRGLEERRRHTPVAGSRVRRARKGTGEVASVCSNPPEKARWPASEEALARARTRRRLPRVFEASLRCRISEAPGPRRGRRDKHGHLGSAPGRRGVGGQLQRPLPLCVANARTAGRWEIEGAPGARRVIVHARDIQLRTISLDFRQQGVGRTRASAVRFGVRAQRCRWWAWTADMQGPGGAICCCIWTARFAGR